MSVFHNQCNVGQHAQVECSAAVTGSLPPKYASVLSLVGSTRGMCGVWDVWVCMGVCGICGCVSVGFVVVGCVVCGCCLAEQQYLFCPQKGHSEIEIILREKRERTIYK